MGKLNELQQKRLNLEQGGGKDSIEKQHQSGKKTARERLSMLFDDDTFVEVGAFVNHRCVEFDMNDNKFPADGVVTGHGAIDGRLVYAFAQDFTVVGGAVGEMNSKKICNIFDLALKTGAPVIGIYDSNGARVEEGVDVLKGFGETFKKMSDVSGVVPHISVISGPCAGGASFAPALSDFVFAVKGSASLFVNSPSIIKGSGNDDITSESLGGAEALANKSGIASIVCENEDECFQEVRELLSYLPSNALNVPMLSECSDATGRILNLSEGNYENGISNIKSVISDVVDDNKFFETRAEYAKNIVTGFARMNGLSVGIVANQSSQNDGLLDSKASEKAARFVRFCDCFSIPVITFTDVAGYVASKDEEQNGLSLNASKLVYAFSEMTAPKVNVIVGKAYGSAYIAMNSKHLGADICLAWPNADISIINSVAASELMFGNDTTKKRAEKLQDYKERFANPYVAASRGYVDDIINPSETRLRIIAALEMLFEKSEAIPPKKHGNMPL